MRTTVTVVLTPKDLGEWDSHPRFIDPESTEEVSVHTEPPTGPRRYESQDLIGMADVRRT